MSQPPVLYIENHSLGEWFKKAYGDEGDKKLLLIYREVRSANCTKNQKEDIPVDWDDFHIIT